MTDSSKKPSLSRRMILMLIAVGLLLGGLVGFNIFKTTMIKGFLSKAKEPPATVSTIVAKTEEWSTGLNAIGALRAFRAVDVSPEVSGSIREVAIHSGQHVKAGDLLIQLSDDMERAQLKTLLAARDLAKITLERDRRLLAIQTVAQSQVDNDEADLKSKEAQIEAQQALINKKRLLAPFTGEVGITQAAPGQFVNPGDKLANLQDLSLLLIDFSLPQSNAHLAKIGKTVELKLDAFPQTTFKGVVTARSALVDSNTRNLEIEARVDNAEGRLIPGMFAEVRLVDQGSVRYLTLPQTAVAYNPYGAIVYTVQTVMGADGQAAKLAQQVIVQTGPTRGDQVSILAGLKEGAEVISSGQLKVKNGTPLVINNTVMPAADPNPKPQDH